jgi:hypothetical protein
MAGRERGARRRILGSRGTHHGARERHQRGRLLPHVGGQRTPQAAAPPGGVQPLGGRVGGCRALAVRGGGGLHAGAGRGSELPGGARVREAAAKAAGPAPPPPAPGAWSNCHRPRNPGEGARQGAGVPAWVALGVCVAGEPRAGHRRLRDGANFYKETPLVAKAKCSR